MRSPNPIDQTKYVFLDMFNGAGNMLDRAPTLGIPWSSNSPNDGSIVTLATGGMDFPLASASIMSLAYLPLSSVNKKIMFDAALGTVKPIFVILRNNEDDPQAGSGDGVRVRLKDNAGMLLTIEEYTGGVSTKTLFSEQSLGASITLGERFPVVIVDDGKTVSVKIAGFDEVKVSTTIHVDNTHEFIAFQTGNTTDHQVHELRIW